METPAVWTINMTQMLAALSDALDCVEGELIGVSLHHAKRIACLCAALGRRLGLDEEALFDLCACALLHDNALPEYIATEYTPGSGISLGAHCVSGEANMQRLPVFTDVKDVLLYHHEEADGTGPFAKRNEDVPLYARLVHLTDILDATFDLRTGAEKLPAIRAFLTAESGRMFDAGCVRLLLEEDLDALLESLRDARLPATMRTLLPQIMRTLTPAQTEDFAMLFAAVIDYKSAFTARHSQGVAEKVLRMADFYQIAEPERMKLLLAGALHDVGKLVIPNDLLEKPGKLTQDEYQTVQNHAYATWRILEQIAGLDDVKRWAALHHEKLDGSGYPFGLKAENLSRNERLMACIDIYQAMTEPRPYKPGLSHADAMRELDRLAALELLDAGITADIGAVFA
ncbi:MAG: HD domain-containing phosphohydrolase [Clostridia bacterium]|nr:HD domain-containing phosphohydrolase [Clostridia bacterium]